MVTYKVVVTPMAQNSPSLTIFVVKLKVKS